MPARRARACSIRRIATSGRRRRLLAIATQRRAWASRVAMQRRKTRLSWLQRPWLVRAARMRSMPASVRGPVLQAAMQAAAAVLHRRLTAGEAAARAGAAARGEGRIATWRPILQSAAPLGMGFYHRQRLCADFGGCAGWSWRWSSSRSRKRNWVDIRAALPVSLLVMSENWAGCAARRKAASAA